MSLNELGKEAYRIAREHGFYDKPPSIPERLCLIHSEVSEALEAYRVGDMGSYGEKGKPEGFNSELADVVIRLVDLCAYADIDIDKAIAEKMKYNEGRPFMHGGKRF